MELFFKLLMAHAVTDWALQTEFIARTKNRHIVPEYLDKDHLPMWPYTLAAHALINALGVYLVTNSWQCGVLELVFHWLIDFGKCEKLYNLHWDQSYHMANKFFYFILVQCAIV